MRINESFLSELLLVYTLDDSAELLAETSEGIPLLWRQEYGAGAFMVFNGQMLQYKTNRGLFAGALSKLVPEFTYPVFNSKVVFIDDFPAPLRSGIDQGLYEDYGRDIPTFYKEVWWPDMLKTASRHRLNYTAALIKTFNDRVAPPFDDPEDEDANGLISFGREIIKSGGEIGLHGYNHQPLQSDADTAERLGAAKWNGEAEMAQSLLATRRYFEEAFPNYNILSYVPPSYVLSDQGREALKQAFPELASISSLYEEDNDGDTYSQEFALAPDGILEMPIITSGYLEKPSVSWAEANGVMLHGYFSHIIHPHDLLDTEINTEGWDRMHESFDSYMARVDRKYPWLRPLTATETAIDMVSVLTSSIEWSVEEDGTRRGSIHPYEGTAYFLMRTERSIVRTDNCDVRKVDEDLYLIAARGADFALKLGDSK